MVLCSLLTPTHDAKHLARLAMSIQQQRYQDFEWIIVPNRTVTSAMVVDAIGDSLWLEGKLKIIPLPAAMGRESDQMTIGSIKRFAFFQAEGELLFEIDHDDTLHLDCLAEIVAEYEKGKPGFLYSDTVTHYPDQKSVAYPSKFGWTNYNLRYFDVDYTANKSFPCSPSSLQYIWYSPNHVRVWSREAYEKVGGHDPSLLVCDDHDLMARTYVAGIEMRHVSKPLYFYREDNVNRENSYRQFNAIVQSKTKELANKYTVPLIHEWCRRENLRKIDLGGAHGCPEGYESLDKAGDVAIKWDCLSDYNVNSVGDYFSLPFEDNSVGVFRAQDFFEHIPMGQPIVEMMNELYRCLAPGGWILSNTPSSDGRGAFQDPTHKSFWNENSFWYYSDKNFAKYVPEIQCRFQLNFVRTFYPTKWHEESKISYVTAYLVAAKGQPMPGGVKI